LQAAVLPVIVISASMWIAYSVGSHRRARHGHLAPPA
jgi:hypothetical protein